MDFLFLPPRYHLTVPKTIFMSATLDAEKLKNHHMFKYLEIPGRSNSVKCININKDGNDLNEILRIIKKIDKDRKEGVCYALSLTHTPTHV